MLAQCLACQHTSRVQAAGLPCRVEGLQVAVEHTLVVAFGLLCAGEPYRQQVSSSSGHWGSMSSIMDHHNVVWLGDLNYRLTCSDEEARK